MTGAPSPARPDWREREHGISVDLRVTPGAGQAVIRGVQDIGDGYGAPAVEARANALDGKANKAVNVPIAGAPANAPAHVDLMTGGSARGKSLHVQDARQPIVQSVSTLLASRQPIAHNESYRGSS